MRSEYYECEAAKDQEKYHSPICVQKSHTKLPAITRRNALS